MRFRSRPEVGPLDRASPATSLVLRDYTSFTYISRRGESEATCFVPERITVAVQAGPIGYVNRKSRMLMLSHQALDVRDDRLNIFVTYFSLEAGHDVLKTLDDLGSRLQNGLFDVRLVGFDFRDRAIG